MRRLRLEWVFRLIVEPGRLWRRYILGNPVFLARVVRQKLIAARAGGNPAVNSRFVARAGRQPLGEAANTAGTAAIVTASYAPDFERCRLLCETIDRFVTGAPRHYILVEQRDVALFRQLETRNRMVISERDLLPDWLRPYNDPLSLFSRRIWLSRSTQPLRGWHVQQLRRIAIASACARGRADLLSIPTWPLSSRSTAAFSGATGW